MASFDALQPRNAKGRWRRTKRIAKGLTPSKRDARVGHPGSCSCAADDERAVPDDSGDDSDDEMMDAHQEAMQQLKQAHEANKDMAMKLSSAELKATQLEASLKIEEATVAKLKEYNKVLIAEVDVMVDEYAKLEAKLEEAEEKESILRNDLIDADLKLKQADLKLKELLDG